MPKWVISEKDLRFKKRSQTSHKGQNGKVLVIGGSEDYVGAIVLAGMAALRAGVDWVTIAAPEKTAWAANTFCPDLVTKKLKGKHLKPNHVRELVALSKNFDAILIGNGLGLHADTKRAVTQLVSKIKKPMVLDADALKVVDIKKLHHCLLTPHKDEFKALLKTAKLKEEEIQKHLGDNVLLIKGHEDTIMSQNKTAYNHTGNPGMTKAGTGDVLAGLCVAFVAMGDDLFDAACKAAFLNGRVGDLLLKKKGYYSFIASDIVEDIKKTVQRLAK